MNNQQFRMKKIVLSLAAVLGMAPVLASAATEVNWGGDIIIRPFHRDNARDFNSSATDTKNFTTERARLKANINVGDDVGGVVELLHFRKWGAADPNRVVDNNGIPNGSVCTTPTTGAGAGLPGIGANGVAGTTNISCANPAMDDNWLDLNQAYIEVKNLFGSPVYMKAGRQEMAYGDQRLIGNTNFWSTYPFPRSYDAFKFGVKSDAYDIDAWTAKVTERQLGILFGATPTTATAKPSDRDFSGIWATLKQVIPDNTIDLYVLNMTDNGYTASGALSTYEGIGIPPNFGQFPYVRNTTAGTTTGDGTRVYNWGTRLKGKYSNLDYTVELNHQTGTFGGDGQSITADGDAVVVGYTIPEALGLRISGEYVYASGDDTPNSGDHKTFYQFTPSPHMHLGAQDFIAFQNIKAWRLGASMNAKENLKLSADYWNFELDKQQDFWYGSNGINTRGTFTNAAGVAGVGLANGADGLLTDRKIGTELDLIAKYEYSKPLSLELGYSVFNPGTGIKNTPATQLTGRTGTDSAKFAWGMLMLKF